MIDDDWWLMMIDGTNNTRTLKQIVVGECNTTERTQEHKEKETTKCKERKKSQPSHLMFPTCILFADFLCFMFVVFPQWELALLVAWQCNMAWMTSGVWIALLHSENWAIWIPTTNDKLSTNEIKVSLVLLLFGDGFLSFPFLSLQMTCCQTVFCPVFFLVVILFLFWCYCHYLWLWCDKWIRFSANCGMIRWRLVCWQR